MKKFKLSLIIAMLGIVSLVSAQSASLNVKGGLNMSSFYGNNLSGKDVKPGYHAGIALDLEFADDISLQTGLYFTSKGAEYSHFEPQTEDKAANGFDGYVEYSVSANYIHLPLHLAYKMDVTPSTRVFFHAGPYFAYGVSGKRNYIKGWEKGNYTEVLGPENANTFSDEGGFKPFDMGLGLGVGAEFGVIVIDLGWDMGFKNISKMNRGIAKINKEKIKNQSTYLSIGYKF